MNRKKCAFKWWGALILLPVLGGCATTAENRIMSSWEGEKIDSVFMRWGLPQQKTRLSNGDTMYQWATSGSIVMPGPSTSQITATGHTATIQTFNSPGIVTQTTCRRTFIASKDGTIKSWSWAGNDCCVMTISGQCAALVNDKKSK